MRNNAPGFKRIAPRNPSQIRRFCFAMVPIILPNQGWPRAVCWGTLVRCEDRKRADSARQFDARRSRPKRTRIMEFDFGVNQGFVEEQYLRYQGNPASVDPSWRRFFEALEREHGAYPLSEANGAEA